MGERPLHPALLDWLASDFVEHGWQYEAVAQTDHDLDGLPAIVAPQSERSPARSREPPLLAQTGSTPGRGSDPRFGSCNERGDQ